MKFGKTLRDSVYEPWKEHYIDYAKLKSLLREDKVDDEDEHPWTERDEALFSEELITKQLENVARFQEDTFHSLKHRVKAAFDSLKELAPEKSDVSSPSGEGSSQSVATHSSIHKERLKEIEKELNSITREIRELKKFTIINYTGFNKIVKKHDRKRGHRYKVRPMMQVSMSNRPFTSEPAYSPLLKKLSVMYFIIRRHLEEGKTDQKQPVDLENEGEVYKGERYTARKFWIHPDNLLEVKTFILPRLPALVYSAQSSKDANASDDPTITSLYFDSPRFDLYNNKIDRQSAASSLRIRWYGQLSSQTALVLEKKTVDELKGSSEVRMQIKDKYIMPFLEGEYNMEKTVSKMERQGQSEENVAEFTHTVDQLRSFIDDEGLSPVLRANYVRTAFQQPDDDRIRISIDTNLAFIREDTLDTSRPCRDPQQWHRTDIDANGMAYPFKDIRTGEVSKFPYSVLEIKIREDGNRKLPAWVEDLMSSYLVHPAPRFSKFVHGVACLFDDYVNKNPLWMADLERDIRKDPQKAFEADVQRRAEKAVGEEVVGSFLGTKVSSYKPSKNSPMAQSHISNRLTAESTSLLSESARAAQQDGAADEEGEPSQARDYGTISAIFPSFSISRYSRARRAQESRLPEGVVEPQKWLKNAGELKIEPKVWLANERTFLKWQHICVLLGGLGVSLYSAAGRDTIAEVMGIVYLFVAAFAGIWGYVMMKKRREMIMQRSGKDFDNMVGPMIVSSALMIALILNLGFQWRAAYARWSKEPSEGASESPINEELR